jgi:hypothetical protein
MTASPHEALKLQRRPLPDGSLRIVASGVKEDPGRADDVKLEDDDFTPSRRSRGSGDHGRRTLPSLRAVQPAIYRRNRWVSSK